MAEAEGAVLVVDLGLEKAEARVEGNGGVEVLVAGDGVVGGVVADEGRVVAAQVGYLVIVAVAEVGRVVAGRAVRPTRDDTRRGPSCVGEGGW